MEGSSYTEKELRCLDIYAPLHGVEVQISHSVGDAGKTTMWVNVDGICRLRISGMVDGETSPVFDDQRHPGSPHSSADTYLGT